MRAPAGPSATVTIVFTDIEGSTRLWERFPDAMRRSLERHDSILRETVVGGGGQVVKTTGDGVMAAFVRATDALRACADAQLALARAEWPETGPLRVRMGVHAGEVTQEDGDYHGPSVNRAARIMAAGHGGQVLLSSAAASLVMDDLPEGWSLLDLGEHRLKDLVRPERVFQLVHPDLDAAFPPLSTQDGRGHQLPAESSAFVGRDAELRQVEDRLRSGSVRLLTLTGPGGIGKTRLALRAASDLRPEYGAGSVFVDLSAARDAASVLLFVAREIGLADASDRAQVDELANHLRDQQLLMVLDNFEQVTAAAPDVARLLQGCPRLTLLVTSRESLRITGEHLFPVPPLAVPESDLRAPSMAQVEGYESVRLFVERARTVRPDFRLTDENAAAVAEITRRLDGLPLAIELATARIGLFSPEALRDRLGSRLALLRSGARDQPERQQTLRATIDWSYQLLQPTEQRLLGVIAAFAGTGIEDLETVAGRLNGRLAGLDPIDGLASLVAKSLVRQSETLETDPRFTMLETIREFATERLDEDPEFAAAVRRGHAHRFADFAAEQAGRLTGPGREAALARMAADAENLRACWRYWVAERDLDRLDGLVDALWPLYDAKGWYRSTIELAADLLGVLAGLPQTEERLRMGVTLRMSQARALLSMQGYTEEVEKLYADALESFGDSPEAPQIFPVLRGLADLYTYRAEFAKGAQIGRQIQRLAEVEGDVSMRVEGHLVLGSSLAFLSDLEGGIRELDLGIRTFEEHPYQSGRYRLGTDPRVVCLTTSGFLLWLMGRLDDSLERADRALAMASSLGHPATLAYARFHTGLLHLWRSEPDVVRDRALGVLQVADEAELPIWRAIGTCLLGASSAALGRTEEGVAQVREGISLYRGLRTPPVFWPNLLSLDAGACAAAGRWADGLPSVEEAIELAASAEGSPVLPELHTLRGDLLAQGGGSHADARVAYERAFELAAPLGARMPQLRAAVRLVRIAAGAEAEQSAMASLAGVYATFSQGLAAADLVEARELLGRRL